MFIEHLLDLSELDIIGASLSEPHTSVTALHARVCMLVRLFGRPLTGNFIFQMSAFKILIFHDVNADVHFS